MPSLEALQDLEFHYTIQNLKELFSKQYIVLYNMHLFINASMLHMLLQ